MESRLNMDDFERSLKEQADKFYMIPSDRIWKSLYNDLHPGSRWPSLAVGIILLISLFWIGNSNQNSTNSDATNNIQQSSNTTKSKDLGFEKPKEIQKPAIQKQSTPSEKSEMGSGILIPTIAPYLVVRNKEKEIAPVVNITSGISVISENTSDKPVQNRTSGLAILENSTNKIPHSGMQLQVSALNKVYSQEWLHAKSRAPILEKNLETNTPSKTEQNLKISGSSSTEGLQQVTAATKPTSAKRKKSQRKASWTFFVSPEISSVHFEGNNLNKPTSGVVVNPNSQHEINSKTRIGFQTGADVNYKITKNIDFTSGFHLGYAGYNIMAELAHPALATVTFKDAKGNLFTKNYISYYGNESNGSLKITNYNMQFAIPIGLEWTLFDQDNVRVSVASAIEPFLVLNSKAYILTGDGRKFITDPDLIRRFNLNGNFGSYITFSSHKVAWKIGPTVRYQVLSTYHNIYPIREHLINYGIRIGVSKPH